MVIVYITISIVRPVLEYACPVWHTNLPIYLSDSIGMIQKRTLRSIFPGESYHVILNRTGLCALKERRYVSCKKYFRNMQMNSHKLNHLLPQNSDVLMTYGQGTCTHVLSGGDQTVCPNLSLV